MRTKDSSVTLGEVVRIFLGQKYKNSLGLIVHAGEYTSGIKCWNPYVLDWLQSFLRSQKGGYGIDSGNLRLIRNEKTVKQYEVQGRKDAQEYSFGTISVVFQGLVPKNKLGGTLETGEKFMASRGLHFEKYDIYFNLEDDTANNLFPELMARLIRPRFGYYNGSSWVN